MKRGARVLQTGVQGRVEGFFPSRMAKEHKRGILEYTMTVQSDKDQPHAPLSQGRARAEISITTTVHVTGTRLQPR